MDTFGKRFRQEGAIKRTEAQLAMHEANTELTAAIMTDNILPTGVAYKVESIRAKKIERAKITSENTKENMK